MLGICVFAATAVNTGGNVAYAVGIVLLFALLIALQRSIVWRHVWAKRFAVNPVTAFISVICLGWLWGPLGMLISVPMLVATRICCSHFAALAPLGRVLGRP
jgi:predicted PurR-regulated permease PerM